MHQSKIIFKMSDVFHHPLRNYKRYAGITTERGLVFDARYGDETKADVYYPTARGEAPLPVFVNVHGGGYVCGDKKYRGGIARLIASHGWFVVNINYRLSPKYKYPAATEDVITALNFVNTLGAKYNLDLGKIILSGDSAGAYYASHAAAAIYDPALSERLGLPTYTGKPLRALLTFCAPFNLEQCFTTKTLFDVSTDITNCVFGTSYKGYSYEFPERDTTNVLNFVNPGWCETFISAALRDSFCGGQIDAMTEKLKASGVPYKTYLADQKGDSHCTHLLPFLKGSKPNMDAVIHFLEDIHKEYKI